MVALIASAALVTALVIPGVGFAADPDPADYPALSTEQTTAQTSAKRAKQRC
jgi:hypothetical protein